MKRVVAASDKMKDIYAFQLIGFFAYPCLSVLDLTFKPQDGHAVSLIEKSVKHSGHLLTFIILYFTMRFILIFVFMKRDLRIAQSDNSSQGYFPAVCYERISLLLMLVVWRLGSRNKKGNYDSRDEAGMIRYQRKPGIRNRS